MTEELREVNQTHFSYRNYFIIFVLRWDVVKLIKNTFIKIKRQLMLTNLTCARSMEQIWTLEIFRVVTDSLSQGIVEVTTKG